MDTRTEPAPVLRLGGAPLPLVGPARMYVCGITPYDVTHLGHAATFVWADTIARVLRLAGVETVTCRNVTDVDDVLIEAANRAGAYVDRFAAVNQFHFDHDMQRLGVRRPEHEPRSRGYIAHVIRLASALLAGGSAYVSGGSVFFHAAPALARSGLDRAEALRLATEFGGRPDDPAKDDPLDAAVWQAAGPGEPAWDSPWGRGRPGWHAECAAMAQAVFGPALDLHAGGADLAFPHHAFEAAMAEASTGVRPFARRWVHVGTVRIGGAKMAKSVGNLILVDDLLADHPAAAVRLLVLDRRPAEPWDYTPAALDAAERRVERLYAAAGRPTRAGSDEAATAAAVAALLDDLDVPRALDIAEERGGPAGRMVAAALGLM